MNTSPNVQIPDSTNIEEIVNGYYNKYLKHFRQNILLNNQLQFVRSENEKLTEKYESLQVIILSIFSLHTPWKRKEIEDMQVKLQGILIVQILTALRVMVQKDL